MRYVWILALLAGLPAAALVARRAVAQQDAPAAAQPETAADPAAEAAPTRGFFQIVFSGGITGAAIILVLFGLSLTAAYLAFEQIMTLRHSELMPDELAENVRRQLEAGQLAAAQDACDAQPSFLAFVISQGLAEVESGWDAVEKALEDALAEQSARLFRRVEYLSVIGAIAPMVGLLGTVIGMIFAFQKVEATQGVASAGDLAGGIYQALVTTVGGLLVAIPSLGAFAIFRNRIDQLAAEAAYQVQIATRPLKRRLPSKPGAAPAAPPPPPRGT